ncbi:MAG TPA: serine/threonine protein kinase [Candidatus Nitrosotalea sp.]|nr:serine/threonine protein kinase [Candidatus Nitrosotalea sp.]
MDSFSIPVSKLVQGPYSQILGYPKATKKELARRALELKKLGIRSVTFGGPTVLNSVPVLGKGYVGVVVLSKVGKDNVALKIRRVDSSREEMGSEAKLLRAANKVNVGPRLIKSSKNFIVMEYLEGKRIIDWVQELKGRGSASKFRRVARQILEDCYRLDSINLDHGELSYIHKHVIVGKSPRIIDFESASLNRRTSNVTSATQSIFIGSALSCIVKKIVKIPSKKTMIGCLKKYKHDQSRDNFEHVLHVLGLDKN